MDVAARNYAEQTAPYQSPSLPRSPNARGPSLVACPEAQVENSESGAADACEVDEAEIAELVERYGHRVRYFTHRIQVRYRIDPQWHDDLISAGNWGLFKAVRNRRADAHERELSAYVSRRVEGAIIDEARRVLNRVTVQADCDPSDLDSGLVAYGVDSDWELGSAQEDPEEMADRSSRWRSIDASIEHLDAGQRALLREYADGDSLSEIARGGDQTASRLQSEMARIARQVRAHSPELRRLLRHEI